MLNHSPPVGRRNCLMLSVPAVKPSLKNRSSALCSTISAKINLHRKRIIVKSLMRLNPELHCSTIVPKGVWPGSHASTVIALVTLIEVELGAELAKIIAGSKVQAQAGGERTFAGQLGMKV